MCVTYWIFPPCVLSSTEKVEECDPAAEAGLSLLHHHLYKTYFTWALNDVVSPSLECNTYMSRNEQKICPIV